MVATLCDTWHMTAIQLMAVIVIISIMVILPGFAQFLPPPRSFPEFSSYICCLWILCLLFLLLIKSLPQMALG